MAWTLVRTSVELMRIVNVFYVFVFFGVLSAVPEYVEWLSWALTAAVAVVLLALFHPFRGAAAAAAPLNADLNALIFAAGFILLTNVVLTGAARVPVISGWLRAGRETADRAGLPQTANGGNDYYSARGEGGKEEELKRDG